MPIKTLIAALLATTVSTAAIAQGVSADVNAGAAAGMKAGTTAMDANAGLNAGASASADAGNSEMTYGNLISELQRGATTADQWAAEIASLDENASVEIVPLSELQMAGNGAENASALDQAMSDNQEEMATLHTAIDGKVALTDALTASNYSSADVIAVDVDGADGVRLVVDDRS